MTRDATELAVLKKNTDAFIASNPTDIVITRIEEQSDGHGGFLPGEPVDLEPQTVKIQPMRDRANVMVSTAGEAVDVPTHEVVARWDADIKKNDTFEYRGDPYRVVFVDTALDYVVRAEVNRHGS